MQYGSRSPQSASATHGVRLLVGGGAAQAVNPDFVCPQIQGVCPLTPPHTVDEPPQIVAPFGQIPWSGDGGGVVVAVGVCVNDEQAGTQKPTIG